MQEILGMSNTASPMSKSSSKARLPYTCISGYVAALHWYAVYWARSSNKGFSPYRYEVFLDQHPEQDNWKIRPLMEFSMYPIVYNLSYQQDYNDQPIYEINCLFLEDSESDNNTTHNLYRSYLYRVTG